MKRMKKLLNIGKKYKILQEKIAIIWKYKKDKKLDKKLLKKNITIPLSWIQMKRENR